MKKRILFLSVACAAALAFTSCSKKDAASLGELNGDWKLVSGTSTEIDKNFDSDNDLFSTTTTTLTFNGETCVGQELVNYVDSDIDDQTEDVNQNIKMSISFDKKEGSYTRTLEFSEQETEEDLTYYIADPNVQGSYITQEFDVIYDYINSQVETGDFYVNQASGELAKGSQINLANTKTVSTTSFVKKFYKSGESQEFTGSVYESEWDWNTSQNVYTVVVTQNTSITTEESTEYSDAEVLTVVESTKKSLTITSNVSYSSITEVGIIESNKTENSSVTEFTFEKQ